MRNAGLLVALLIIIVFVAGCGETINGMAKDTTRIGSGIRKVFIRE